MADDKKLNELTALPSKVAAGDLLYVVRGGADYNADATDLVGPIGADGLSAYQIAVAEGFEGTESQWLASLVGAKGDTGAAGGTGATGAKGDTGSTGAQGIQGIQGVQGPQGPQGPAGSDATVTAAAVAGVIDGATAEATLADTDTFSKIVSGVLKKFTYANLKAALKTYFDTLYQAAGTYLTPTSTNSLTNKTLNDASNYIDANATHAKFYNDTGVTLLKGQAVYLVGWNVANSCITVGLARANSSSTMPCLGLIEANTAHLSTGEVRTSGTLTGLDTSAFSTAANLYVSSATAGALTATAPSANEQHVATVAYQHATAGVLEIHVSPDAETYTGTGNEVRATSPALVTPNIGTPSAGTLTNCTGLPEAGLTIADNTTKDVSTSAHGFAPKAPNDATKYLDGTGAWSTKYAPLTTQTDTYTLALTDAGKWLRGNKSTAFTITIPRQADVAWAAETEIFFEQQAAGQLTVAAGTDVTLNNAGATAKTRAQYSVLGLKRVASNVWTLFGDTAAS